MPKSKSKIYNALLPLATGMIIAQSAIAEVNFDYSSDAPNPANGKLPEFYADYPLTPHPVIYRPYTEQLPQYSAETWGISTDELNNEYYGNDIWEDIRSGFKLPQLDNNLVKKYEKWYSRKPEYFVRTLNRGAPYIAHILQEIKKRKLPTEFVLLPVVESAFKPRVYSVAGAAGLWQFMPATGKLYDLEQNWWYEGRRDIVRSTDAALRHLLDLYEFFEGDWFHAIAAYNAGSQHIKGAIDKNKLKNKSIHYSDLRLYLETRNYVPKLIALKNIISNPKAYGIELPNISIEPAFASVDFGFQINLTTLVQETGLNPNQIALLNPGLRRSMTPPNGPYEILIPSEDLEKVLAWKSDLSPTQAVNSFPYTVKRGDVLSTIAEKHNVRIATIKSINSKESDLIRIGEILYIPNVNTTVKYNYAGVDTDDKILHEVAQGDTLTELAVSYNVSLDVLKSINSLTTDTILIGQKLQIPTTQKYATPAKVTASAIPTTTKLTHVVAEKESLWKISKNYGIKINDLIKWNSIDSSNSIYPGQKLTIFVD